MSEKHTSQVPTQTARFAAFVGADSIALLQGHLEKLRRSAGTVHVGGTSEARAWCSEHDLPDVLLVDIGKDPFALATLIDLAESCGPQCRIVALGEHSDVDLYRQMLRAGIADYLLKPLQFEQFADVLRRADQQELPIGSIGARAGRTVAIVGATGGLGCSTLTAALGQWIALKRSAPTVLVDFDRRKSDLSLLLGLHADAGLASVLAAPEIDPRLLQRTLLPAGNAQERQRLHLLAQQPGEETAVNAERVLELGAALCQLFSLAIWDLPAHRPVGASEVLAHADIRIVLTEQSVQGARHTLSLLSLLGDESHGQRLLLVTSALRQSGRPAIEATQFEDFVGRKVDMHLPHAGSDLSASLLGGPLRADASPAYAHALARLASQVLGLPPVFAPPAPRGALPRLRALLGSPRNALAR